MALKSLPVNAHWDSSEEQLNFFKFARVVFDEFPKAICKTFVTLWDSKFGSIHPWDDSDDVHCMLQEKEGLGKNGEKLSSFDSTMLFKITLFAKSFSLHGLVPRVRDGTFHGAISGCSKDEAIAIALDQLRRLRNMLCHQSSTRGIDTSSLHKYLQLAKGAFVVLGEDTEAIDTIARMAKEDFSADKMQTLEDQLRREIEVNTFLRRDILGGFKRVEKMGEQLENTVNRVEGKVDWILHEVSGRILLIFF